MSESIISFPNLKLDFLKDMHINRVAFTIGNIEIYWYGIILTLGIIAAFTFVMLRIKKEGIISDDILDLAIFTVIIAVVCSRLYYVVTKFPEYKQESFWETVKAVFNIRNGGLAIYGAIIGGAVTAFVVCRVKKMNVLKMFDILSPAVMLGQIIGRWGNFINAEAFGTLEKYAFFGFEWTTPNAVNLPWIMYINNARFTGPVHPTFLYESLWNLLGFIIICIFMNKKKYDGQIFLEYFAFYGIGRAFIEGFRTDSLYVGSIRISQLLGFVAFLVCSMLLIAFAVKGKALGLKVGPAYYKKAIPVSDDAEEEEEPCECDSSKELCESDTKAGDANASDTEANDSEEDDTDAEPESKEDSGNE